MRFVPAVRSTVRLALVSSLWLGATAEHRLARLRRLRRQLGELEPGVTAPDAG